MNDNPLDDKVAEMKDGCSPWRFCMSVAIIVLRAYVLAYYWRWFVMTAFPVLPALSPLNVYVLTITHRMFTLQGVPANDKTSSLQKWEKLWQQAGIWLPAALMGWGYHLLLNYVGG
jgi:hypothetical protein